jgi:hypothetical protein
MKKLNWKFWTWPRQIRELTAKLAAVNKEIDRLRGLQNSKPHSEIHRRGLHRAQL